MVDFDIRLKPVAFARGAPLYLASEVRALTVKSLEVDPVLFMRHRGATMSKAVKEASEVVSGAADEFEIAMQRLLGIEEKFAGRAKEISARTRSSVQSLADGLRKIEGTANFSRLDQYVTLLERAAAAMNSLAELDRSGKLAKIAGALK